jgi:hypothetical protein
MLANLHRERGQPGYRDRTWLARFAVFSMACRLRRIASRE